MAFLGEKGLLLYTIKYFQSMNTIIDFTFTIYDQKKRKLRNSLLILGTGGGDVLALDVSAGQLKWRVSDCHPG